MRPPQDIPVAHIRASATARQVKIGQVMVLVESIKQVGLRQPINVRPVQGGYEVRGGGHRLEAFRTLGRETIPAFVCDDDDLHAELAEIDENYCRADLSPAERALFMSRRKVLYEALHPETRQHVAGGKARQDSASDKLSFAEDAAKKTGKNRRTVERDTHRGGELGEATIKAVIGTSLDKGEELDALAKLSPERREEVIGRAASGDKVSAKVEAKKEARDDKERALSVIQLAAPEPIYGCVLEDYEWDFQVYSRETGMDRHAANHYPTSAQAHEAAEIVKRTEERMRCAAPDCVIGSWCTVPHLAIALEVMRLRGFAYKSSFAWAKDVAGTGYWNRNKHELFLVGTRGKIPAPAMGTQFESLIVAPRAEHSVKPDWQYEFFERHWPHLRKIELNARRARTGWTAYGLEAPTQILDAQVIAQPSNEPSAVLKQTVEEEEDLSIPAFLRRPQQEKPHA